MSNLSKREKILLFSAVLLLIIYLYYRFYLISALKRINELTQSTEIYKSQQVLLNSQDMQNNNNHSGMDNLEIRYRAAVNSIPVNEKNPEIAITIKSIAEENNVVLEMLSIEEPHLLEHIQKSGESLKIGRFIKEDGLHVVEVKAIIKGNMEGIIKFLSSIEKDDRIALINNIKISRDKQSSFQAIVSIYYYFSNNKENL